MLLWRRRGGGGGGLSREFGDNDLERGAFSRSRICVVFLSSRDYDHASKRVLILGLDALSDDTDSNYCGFKRMKKLQCLGELLFAPPASCCFFFITSVFHTSKAGIGLRI